jgi:hypothetical protein
MTSSSDVSPAPGTPQTADKAKVATVIGIVGGVLTFLVAYFPENDDVQLWGGLILGVFTIVAQGFGVFQTANRPVVAGKAV